MNLFRRTRLPSPPPASEEMPPRPQSPRQPMQWERPRGAMVTEGPRVGARAVSSADLAIAAMAVVSLASIGRDYRLQMKVADRLRLVNPAKAPAQPVPQASSEAGPVEKLPTILDLPRAGKEAS